MAEDKADAKGKVKAAKQAKAGKTAEKSEPEGHFSCYPHCDRRFLWVVSAAVLLVYCNIIDCRDL